MFKPMTYYSMKESMVVHKAVHVDRSLTFEPECTINYHFEASLGERFRIHIKKHRLIDIHYGHLRGKDYAHRTLKDAVCNEKLELGIIEGGPAFKIRGVIEGFYGPPWSLDARKDVIDLLHNQRMNAFLYAPKDDQYHRDAWRVPYPDAPLSELVELIEYATEKNIDFYYCISPGKDFNYTKEADFKALFEKIKQVSVYGVKHYALLLDDIDYALKGEDAQAFKSPGLAHAYISNKLNAFLKEHISSSTMIMCPTEYWQNYDTSYRQDIKNSLDQDILVFWTGYNTIAEFIPDMDGEKVLTQFGHDLVLWDNYPVNDVTTDMIFLGPLVNRGRQLDRTHVGMVANPMVEWHLSKPSVITMGVYMWNPATYCPDEAHLYAIQSLFSDPLEQQALKVIASSFSYSLIQYDIDPALLEAVERLDYFVIEAYYKKLMQAVDVLSQSSYQAFIEEIKPWFERIQFDVVLFSALKNKNQKKIHECLEALPNLKHTTGTQLAVRLAIKENLYKEKIYPSERKNYWEE